MTRVVKRATQITLAALLAASMTAADGSGCQRQGDVTSDRPAGQQQVDPARQRTVTIRVTEASGPADVWVRAHKRGEPLGDHSREQIAGPGYEQTLDYSTGQRIEVVVTVTGNPRDIFGCEINDGAMNRARERRAGQVYCKLTTVR